NTEEVTPIVVPAYSEESKKSFIQKMKIKRQEKQKRKEESKGKKEKVLRQTPHILPFLQIHEDYILMKEGCMDILQIESKDLYSSNDEDIKILLLSNVKLYRS